MKRHTQPNLHSFFQVRISPESSSRKYFIYSQSENKASFENLPTESDIFVVARQGIRLYIRNNSISPLLPSVSNYTKSIPLLKSNLQKAIRRCECGIALSTAIVMMQFDMVELLRRLPIICIEDVTYVDTMSVIVWLMMADSVYKPTNTDMWNILRFISDLCDISDYYPNSVKESREYTHESLAKYEIRDCLLSIYYRSIYGGMPGDIKMMESSIGYYLSNPDKIMKSKIRNILSLVIEHSLRILPESADFHCYPKMLTAIRELLPIDADEEQIKKSIWFCSSAYNIRKQETIDKMIEMRKELLWKEIEKVISTVRRDFIPQHITPIERNEVSLK